MSLRRLYPEPAEEVEAAAAYADPDRRPREDRPWVLVNMVTSADGATHVDGVSGGLGGPADRAAFHALRNLADVVLVGAATVTAERYNPPRPGPDGRRPRLAIVSARLSMPWDLALFDDDPRPYLITTTDAEIPDGAPVEVIRAGSPRVDPVEALRSLRDRGVGVVLCEGGPRLNASLASADVLDEWCLTLSPLLVSGDAHRAVVGPALDPPAGLRLVHVLEAEDLLLLRYVRAPRSGSDPAR